MEFQLSYLSPNGHAKRRAQAIVGILPKDTITIDLEKDCELHAETLLLAFEMNEVSPRAVPYRIAELLSRVEHQKVLLLLTVPFRPNTNIKSRVENWLMPFLPQTCSYCGLYFCAGQASEGLLRNISLRTEREPYNRRLGQSLHHCKDSKGHPNEEDLQQACCFVKKALGLNLA